MTRHVAISDDELMALVEYHISAAHYAECRPGLDEDAKQHRCRARSLSAYWTDGDPKP